MAKLKNLRKAVEKKVEKKKEPPVEVEEMPEEETIVPRGRHPENAEFVARDRRSGAEVSFDQWGRKLDSLGHVVAGDRQRAWDAEAKRIARPAPPVEREFVEKPGLGAKLTNLLAPGVSRGATRRSSWDNSVLPEQPERLLPGGVDPRTGLKVETAYNPYRNKGYPQSRPPGLYPEGTEESAPAWDRVQGPMTREQARMPWESFAGTYESPITREPMQVIPGFGMLPESAMPQPKRWAETPNANMPYPPTGDSRAHIPPQPGEGMMYDPYGGNYNGDIIPSSTRRSSGYEGERMVPVPGFGMLPESVVRAQEQMGRPESEWAPLYNNLPERNVPVPGFGGLPNWSIPNLPDTPENFPGIQEKGPYHPDYAPDWRRRWSWPPKVQYDRISPLEMLQT
jgi:hypothetical protein